MVSPVEQTESVLPGFPPNVIPQHKASAVKEEGDGIDDAEEASSIDHSASSTKPMLTAEAGPGLVMGAHHNNAIATLGQDSNVPLQGPGPNFNTGLLPPGLLNGNFTSPAAGGNQQSDLLVLKSMMEAHMNAGQNQNLLNAAGLGGAPGMGLALMGKDGGGLANQMALASSNLYHGQGPLNAKGNATIANIKNENVQTTDSRHKDSAFANFSGFDASAAPKLPEEDANLNLDRLQDSGISSDLTQGMKTVPAAAEAQNVNLLGQQGNGKNVGGTIGLDSNQGINPSLAALIENSGNNPNAQLTQPYMQTLQTLMQQHQQSQQQILNLQNCQQVNIPNGIPSSDLKVNAPMIASVNNTNTVAPPNNRTVNNANDTYRDFSRVGNDGSDFTTTQPPGKDPPFPVKLHRILSNPEYCDVISWLPHGRSWRVLKPKAFEEKVIPLYFRHAKYASFMRQVNGWGFKRMTQGPDHNSYYHELFLRGMQHLCYKMRRPTRARVDSDPDFNPDFYRLSMVAPLPNQDVNNMAGLNNSAVNNMNNVGNNNMLPNLQSGMGLPNPGLQPLAGMAGMNAMAGIGGRTGINNLGTMNAGDNSLSANFLQQQLSQNQNVNIGQQHPTISQGLAQGLQNGGTNLMGIGNGGSDIGQLESLRQRREDLVRQLQRMVNSGNTNNLTNLSNSSIASAPSNANGMINVNHVANATNLQAGLSNPGNMGNLLNSGLGSNTTAQLQQMMSLGMNGASNIPGSAGQMLMMSNNGSFGANAPGVNLNMNNMAPNLTNLGGGINQQLLMQNGMVGGSGLNPNLGLGNLGNVNMMTPNLGAMLQANQLQNQLMGQQVNQNPNSSSGVGANPFGDNSNAS